MAGITTLLRLDKKKSGSARITVEGSGAKPHAFAATGVEFRIALFDALGNVVDLTDHSSLTLAYMPASRAASSIASVTASIEDATFTEAQFQAGSHYHAAFVFDETELNPTLTGNTTDFWMICSGIATATGDTIVHGGCTFTLEASGYENTVDPPDAPDVGITSAQASTLIAASAVRYDVSQSLSGGQKTQALANLGITGTPGDVVGPASATNERIAVFDGTSGKLLKQSSLTVAGLATSAQGTAADAAKVKTDFLTVTQPVDLDAIETRVNALDAAVILKGVWDASAGTFPGSGTAQAGDSWIVSVAGTVDSVAFAIGDRIIAILDNASTSTFASNWFKSDYTDAVSSVAGKTGAVTLVMADITDLVISGAVPSAVASITDGTLNLNQQHNGKLIQIYGNTVAATAQIRTQAQSVSDGQTWLAGAHFWALGLAGAEAETVAAPSGGYLLDQATNGNITLLTGKVYHIWREAENYWRVLAVS